MNRDQFEGSWKTLRGKVREQWGKLTDDDMEMIKGRHDQLVGRIQARYGKAREDAEAEVERWMDSMSSTSHRE